MASKRQPPDRSSGEGPSGATEAKKKTHPSHFKDEWLSERECKSWLRKIDSESAECIWCRREIPVRYGSKGALISHAQSATHKEEERRYRQTQLSASFAKADPSEPNRVTLVEVGEVYHTVMHHHGYASQDCLSQLVAQWYTDSGIAKKESCGRAKAACIVENILAPKSVEMLLGDLDASHFFSVGCDASNKGSRDFYPVTVRYFSVKEGIKEGLLGFYHDNEETGEAIAAHLCRVLEGNGLSLDRVSACVSDNAAVNFGKYRSVFQTLKHLNNRLVEVGCRCHVLHSCLKKGMREQSFDVEAFVTKLYSEFSCSAQNTESLKSFFESVDAEYKDLIRHGTTRWLSLTPALERILQCWPALRAYFLSCGEEECSKMVWEAFSPEEEASFPLCTIYFLHNLMALFAPVVTKLEDLHVTCAELHGILEDLRTKLKERRTKLFYGRSANAILHNLSVSQKTRFREEADRTLSRCIEYLEEGYDFETSVFRDLALFSLEGPVAWEKVESLVKALNLGPDLIDTDKVFDDICIVNRCQREISAQEEKVDQRWVRAFKCIPDGGDSHLLKLVSYILSIPVSNAHCERVFSMMTQLWCREGRRLSDSLVKAELQVRLNFRMSCGEFSDFLKSQPDLLDAARRRGRYHVAFRKQKASPP